MPHHPAGPSNPETQDQLAPKSASSSITEALTLLRTQWKWAAFSQFFFTFSPLFAMNDVSLVDIEMDLARGTKHVLPRIMTRLLYTLSYDRKVSVDNWQSILRKQYERRAPDANPLRPEPHESSSTPSHHEKASPFGIAQDPQPSGSDTVEKDDPSKKIAGQVSDKNCTRSRDWFELPVLEKMDSMHLLTEWHFHHPMRLRSIMKSDDETASWRIEPIGYDKHKNAYWLIGYDRLWIQRAPPSLPRNETKKRRMISVSDKSTPLASRNSKRVRLSHTTNHDTELDTLHRPTRTRTAKANAKVKLTLQAQAWPENQISVAPSHGSRTTGGTDQPRIQKTQTARSASHLVMGTRVSARLRGAQQDEWQPIPNEWMGDHARQPRSDAKNSLFKTGLESDDSFSDLTELSEDAEPLSVDPKAVAPEAKADNPKQSGNVRFYDKDSRESLTTHFVEWETVGTTWSLHEVTNVFVQQICSTLYDWEHISERFQNATHYNEKALYKYLVNEVVPITAERQRKMQEAIIHRKRSSRIAIKESEREQAIAAARKKAEEEEKLSRTRRLEARVQREEERRSRQDTARELRRKEREARTKIIQTNERSARRSITSDFTTHSPEPHHAQSPHKMSTPSSLVKWELDCEICQSHGINIDDPTPMMSCGSCLKWQHIACHDKADQTAGRPKRDWDSVEFICKRCEKGIYGENASGQEFSHYTQHVKRRERDQYAISRKTSLSKHPTPLTLDSTSSLKSKQPVVVATSSSSQPPTTYGQRQSQAPVVYHASPHENHFFLGQVRQSSQTQDIPSGRTPALESMHTESSEWLLYEHSSVSNHPSSLFHYFQPSMDTSPSAVRLLHYRYHPPATYQEQPH
ncbi:hypothetical protein AMATHDRAFT_1625 [Amanita thiersii Skay4041]|uniref:Zinc finger PHD-type domain-containing protein n=1 Tax=Amanita thiersii Skay4041 TaxID=703135 RepID=A0A2A9NYY3_9AGAR|nr:hypothetical protein AMATHDRAFT_1625 [Amanita thiersii Skay4041]